MIVEAKVIISGPRAAIWKAMTDIEHSAKIVSGIENIEIVQRPTSGLVGLRWQETRILFGKPATVEKWITDAVENEFYKTRAESDGFVFLSTNSIAESGGSRVLTSAHDSQPQTIAAKLMVVLMALLFKGVARKAILQDLNDVKSAVEAKT